MYTEVRQENGITTIAVSGSVDALTAADLSNVINGQITAGNVRLVLDLTTLEFMSSAGLRTLLGAVKESRSNGGDLRIASSNPGIDKVLRMSGFNTIAKVFTTSSDAISSFAAQA